MKYRTLFGEAPKGWTYCTLKDIAQLQQGLQIAKEFRIDNFKSGYIPLLKITDLPSRKFSEYVTDIKEQHLAHKEDIIYTRTGQVGLVYTDVTGCVHNNCFKVIIDYKRFDKYFVYYFLRSKEVFDYQNSVASGSVQKDLKHSAFLSCPIAYPEVGIQKKIGKVLKILDDKIELNNKINDNLEELSRTLFNEIFKNVTEKGILSDMSDIVMGQSPSGSSYNEIGDGVVFYQGRAEFGWRFPSRRLFTTEPKRMANENAVLMSVRAPVGDLNIANEGCCIGRGLAAISSKTNAQSFVYYLLDSMKNQLNIYNGEGTVFGSINKEALAKLEIILPSKELVDNFESVVAPNDDEIRRLSENSRSLAKLRDILLPKLMSGEIDLNNFELDI